MPDKKQSILLGGLAAGLLSTSYLGLINQACCLGILLGGVIGVWHYTSENEITIKGGTGAVIGMGASVIAWALSSVLTWALTLVGIGAGRFTKEGVMNNLESNGNLQPEQLDPILSFIDEYYVALYAVNLVVFVIFGAIGGAIGAKLFKKGGDEPTDFDAIEEL